MKDRQDTSGEPVVLSKFDREELSSIQRNRAVGALAARRARILELLGGGHRQADVQRMTGAGIATVGRTRRRFLEEGLQSAVFGYVPPGAPRLLSASQEAKIVALACSDAPAGRAQWSTQLLAEHAVKQGLVTAVGRETVRLVLKHHGIKPWREKNVVRAGSE